jgi:hypothetical protein
MVRFFVMWFVNWLRWIFTGHRQMVSLSERIEKLKAEQAALELKIKDNAQLCANVLKGMEALEKQISDLRTILSARPKAPGAPIPARSFRQFQRETTNEEGEFRDAPSAA